MKKSITLISLLAIILTSYGQTWQHIFGDVSANTFTITEENNFILTGLGYEPMVILREIYQCDSNGDIIWDTSYYCSSDQIPNCITTTPDTGYIIIGVEFPFLNNDIVYQKFNKNNTVDWITNLKMDMELGLQINSVLRTNDNNYVSTGSAISNPSTSLLMTKINENGDSVWVKTYYDESENDCSGLSIVNSHDNSGYFCLADFNSTSLLLKINDTGDTLWTKTININYVPISMINTNDNCLLITAYDNYGAIAFIKIDESGNILWTKDYTSNRNTVYCYSITATHDNGFMTANRFTPPQNEESGLWLMKLDENGDSVYSILPPADLIPDKIIQTSDSLFVLLAHNNYFSFFIKTDSTGDIITNVQSPESSQNKNLICFPNPFVNQISFKTDNTENYSGQLTVYNIFGEIVISRNEIFEPFEIINTSGLKKGIYIFELITDDKKYTSVVKKQ